MTTEHEEQLDRRLWLNVIRQAIEDATAATILGINRTNRIGTALARKDARHWLTKPSRAFEHVCELAGVNPIKVRAYAVQRIAEADQAEADGQQVTRERSFTMHGERKSLSAWAKQHGLTYAVVHQRLSMGWTPERALTTPKEQRTSRQGVGPDFPSNRLGPVGVRHARSDENRVFQT